jgi:hypothetical protein
LQPVLTFAEKWLGFTRQSGSGSQLTFAAESQNLPLNRIPAGQAFISIMRPPSQWKNSLQLVPTLTEKGSV